MTTQSGKVSSWLVHAAFLGLIAGHLTYEYGASVAAKHYFNQAVRAYNHHRFNEAITLLEKAIKLDPELPNLRRSYGNALSKQYQLTGHPEFRQKALAVFDEINRAERQIPPSKEQSRWNERPVLVTQCGLDEESYREWLRGRLRFAEFTDRDRADIYYGLATSYWNESYEITQKYIVQPRPEPKYKIPEDEAARVRGAANQGLHLIEQALALYPEYADARSYKNLLLRQLAAVESDPRRQRELLREADAVQVRAIEMMR